MVSSGNQNTTEKVFAIHLPCVFLGVPVGAGSLWPLKYMKECSATQTYICLCPRLSPPQQDVSEVCHIFDFLGPEKQAFALPFFSFVNFCHFFAPEKTNPVTHTKGFCEKYVTKAPDLEIFFLCNYHTQTIGYGRWPKYSTIKFSTFLFDLSSLTCSKI